MNKTVRVGAIQEIHYLRRLGSVLATVRYSRKKDLLVSEAIVRVFNYIMDTSFLACSYAFRLNLSLERFMRGIRDIEEQPFLIYHLDLDLSYGFVNRERLKKKRIPFLMKIKDIFYSFFSNKVYDKNGKCSAINKGRGIPPVGLLSIVLPVGLLSIVLINLYLDEMYRMVSVVLPRDWKYFRYQTQVIIVISEQSVKKGTKPIPDERIKEIT